MDVPSLEFLIFGALVALAINISKRPLWRRSVLLVANVAFLASFGLGPLQFAPFAGLLALGYAAVTWLEARKSRTVFVAFIMVFVVAFCWLKQYTFVPHTLFLRQPYFIVGMSYVFFRILHLVIDAYQDALPERPNIFAYLAYTLNFTALVSGPIQFYKDYLQTESRAPAHLDLGIAGQAFQRIILGFFKVSIVSPALYWIFQRSIAALTASSSLGDRAWPATFILAVFPVYIYSNFSGYMDVVIGVARFLRLELPENFNRPFTSEGFIEFWGRWHMTLSNWMRTYVYSPLLLKLMYRFPSSRIQPLLGVFCYFIAFFLIGVWHGRTLMFVILGVMLGFGVSINKVYQIAMVSQIGRTRYAALCANPIYSAVSRGLTFSWFAISSLWFWATWPQLSHLTTILGVGGCTLTLLLMLLGATLVLFGLKIVYARADEATGQEPRPMFGALRTAWYTTLAVVTVSVAVALNSPAPHIVYRAF